MRNLLSTHKTREDVLSSLVTFVLSVWPETFLALDLSSDPNCNFFSLS